MPTTLLSASKRRLPLSKTLIFMATTLIQQPVPNPLFAPEAASMLKHGLRCIQPEVSSLSATPRGGLSIACDISMITEEMAPWESTPLPHAGAKTPDLAPRFGGNKNPPAMELKHGSRLRTSQPLSPSPFLSYGSNGNLTSRTPHLAVHTIPPTCNNTDPVSTQDINVSTSNARTASLAQQR